MRFGQSKGGDLMARDAWQVFLLLLFRAEEEQGLRNADRLVR